MKTFDANNSNTALNHLGIIRPAYRPLAGKAASPGGGKSAKLKFANQQMMEVAWVVWWAEG
jgi:hypothetical protein